jgi:hypothetical protein
VIFSYLFSSLSFPFLLLSSLLSIFPFPSLPYFVLYRTQSDHRNCKHPRPHLLPKGKGVSLLSLSLSLGTSSNAPSPNRFVTLCFPPRTFAIGRMCRASSAPERGEKVGIGRKKEREEKRREEKRREERKREEKRREEKR